MKNTNPGQTINLNVESPDDLRDMIHYSGIFEMTDCVVEIDCAPDALAEDLEKIALLLESVINVADITVSSTPETKNFELTISEVSLNYIKRNARFDK